MVGLTRPDDVSDPCIVGFHPVHPHLIRLRVFHRIECRPWLVMAWVAMVLALLMATTAAGSEKSKRSEQQEYQRRLKLIASNDEASAMQLAEWAEGNRLLSEADELYREIIDRNPQHDSARRKLDRLAARRQLVVDSEAFVTTQSLLPHRFLKYETKRFIVLSDASPSWTRIQTSRLERTHHQFRRFAKRLGLSPLPLKHKLVCVLFKDRSAYLDFASTQDNASASWIAGYYAPGADRVVFYNVEHSQGISEARQKLNDMQKEIKLLRLDITRARRQVSRRQSATLRKNVGQYQKHLERETSRIDRFASSLSAATTVHESIHQLFFHTGIQSPRVEYPLWISEGIATAFETGDIKVPFGPDRDYDQRREEFLRMLRNNELFSLDQLVSMVKIASGDEDVVRRVYHQSYAFVTWLCRFRTSGMRDYLTMMRLEPHGESTPQRHLQVFKNAFGDLTRLERAWIKHEQHLLQKSLKTSK